MQYLSLYRPRQLALELWKGHLRYVRRQGQPGQLALQSFDEFRKTPFVLAEQLQPGIRLADAAVELADHLAAPRMLFFDSRDGRGFLRPQFLERIVARARHYGLMVGAEYGEPYYMNGPVRVSDPVSLLVERK